MREERGVIPGDVVVYEPFTLWGSVGGKVTVIDGGKLYVRGAILGDLLVEKGGRVHVYGTVSGRLVVGPESKVILSGLIGRDAVNEGGRLYIDKSGKVLGRVVERSGTTFIEGRDKEPPKRRRDEEQ